MADVAFIYRYYNNGGCDHSSPANATFPENGVNPLSAGSGQCLSPPTGTNRTTVEFNVNASTVPSVSELIVFCGSDCNGTGNAQQLGDACVGAPSGCNVGSFFVLSILIQQRRDRPLQR
ncbi:hypothetical protein BJ912DRAFT_121345 [Pholiota molesta]|nr:hypothetical protein BJ912DRAFT_121345 [Pholiota molesta]